MSTPAPACPRRLGPPVPRAALLVLLGLCALALPAPALAGPGASDAPTLARTQAEPSADFRLPGGSLERERFLVELNAQRIRMNWVAVGTLTGWTLLNIAVGTVGWLLAEDATWRAFFQMTALFNIPILGTAVVGGLILAAQEPSALSLYESLRRGVLLERALLVGIALDVATAGLGAFLWERGLRKDSARTVGWGRALLLHGVVLLGFDAAVLVANARYDARLLLMVPGRPEDAAGLALHLRF